MEEYKKFKDSKDEVAEGDYGAFQFRFAECKEKVTKAFLELNMDGIVAVKAEQEEEEAEEGEVGDAEEAAKGDADVGSK